MNFISVVDFETHAIKALAVAKAVLNLPAFQRSQHISCYLSMPAGELDTNYLVKEVIKAGNVMFKSARQDR